MQQERAAIGFGLKRVVDEKLRKILPGFAVEPFGVGGIMNETLKKGPDYLLSLPHHSNLICIKRADLPLALKHQVLSTLLSWKSG